MRPSAHHLDKKTILYYQNLKKITGFLKRNIFLIVLTLAVWTLLYDPLTQWSGAYQDSDGYMRAIRVYHWLLAPTFSEQPIYESNYPFGEFLHWTRPMDIIWALFTLPFQYMENLKDTVFFSGIFIAPCLGILAAVALTYGLRRTFNIYLTLTGVLLFLINPNVQSFTSPARPDHHALLLCLSVYGVSLVLCWLKKHQNRYLRWLGLTLALCTFTSVEGFILYAVFLSFYLYLYIFKNLSLQPSLKISKYFAFFNTLFWLLNPPAEGLFYPDNNRLSILFVAASWLAFVGIWILEKSRIHTPKLKLLSLWSISLGFILSLITIFGPQILNFPMELAPKEIFSMYCAEFQSIYNLDFSMIAPRWISVLIAIPLNLFMLKKRPYQRLMILNLIIAIPMFILSLWALRFTIYIPLYTILPILSYIDWLYKKSGYSKNKNLNFPAYLYYLILGIFLLQLMAGIPYSLKTKDTKLHNVYQKSTVQTIKNIGGTLATDYFLGPRYVWEADVNIVASPYHNNKEGISDTQKLFSSETPGEAIPIILKHQITQILLFDNYNVKAYPLDEKNKNKLYYRILKQENIPPFLKEVPDMPENTYLYQIKI